MPATQSCRYEAKLNWLQLDYIGRIESQTRATMADIFISIPFKGEFKPVSDIIRMAAERAGLTAYQVDEKRSADPIAEEIRARIQASRVVVADITGKNPNVYHEVGLAQAYGKTLILLSRESPNDAAFNVRGLRIVPYDTERLPQLANDLDSALRETVSPNELLRAMIVPASLGRPTEESRFVVAASPLSFRRAVGRAGGWPRLRRTASDYVGIRGIMQGFGLLYGFDTLPDIVDTEDCQDEVLSEEMTVYCIASTKANRWTRTLLDKYAERWPPRLEFRAEAKSKNLRNIPVSIFSDDNLLHPDGWDFDSPEDRYRRDFGLVVRGPNPFHPGKMMAVLAGRSSLGTEAACRAFLEPATIQRIRERLNGYRVDLEDHARPFWVLVSMRRTVGDGLEEAIDESLRVERVESFHTSRR